MIRFVTVISYAPSKLLKYFPYFQYSPGGVVIPGDDLESRHAQVGREDRGDASDVAGLHHRVGRRREGLLQQQRRARRHGRRTRLQVRTEE